MTRFAALLIVAALGVVVGGSIWIGVVSHQSRRPPVATELVYSGKSLQDLRAKLQPMKFESDKVAEVMTGEKAAAEFDTVILSVTNESGTNRVGSITLLATRVETYPPKAVAVCTLLPRERDFMIFSAVIPYDIESAAQLNWTRFREGK